LYRYAKITQLHIGWCGLAAIPQGIEKHTY
jgi:hypothetical protein